MRTALIVALLLGAAPVCRAQNSSPGAKSQGALLPEDVAREAYDLFSSIYRNSSSLAPDEVLAIGQRVYSQTGDARQCVKPRTGEERLMLDNFIQLNQVPHVWEARFDFGRAYKLVGERETNEAIDCIHPVGRVAPKACEQYVNVRFVRFLSAPGFNRDRTRALFAFNRVCGGLCGNGTVLVYRKTARGWEEEPRTFATCLWVASAPRDSEMAYLKGIGLRLSPLD
jgi:hypothetical protein